MQTDRAWGEGTFKVGTTLGNSEAIPYAAFAGGHIHVPATEAVGITLTSYVGDSSKEDATFSPALTSSGGAIVQTVDGGKAIEVHPSLFAALQIKIVASAISSGTSIAYKVTMGS